MSRAQAPAVALLGLVLIVAGLTWALGPWVLVVSGSVLLVVALLVPERWHGEPVDKGVARDLARLPQ